MEGKLTRENDWIVLIPLFLVQSIAMLSFFKNDYFFYIFSGSILFLLLYLITDQSFKFFLGAVLAASGVSFLIGDLEFTLIQIYFIFTLLYLILNMLSGEKVIFESKINNIILLLFGIFILSFAKLKVPIEGVKEIIRWIILLIPLYFTVFILSKKKQIEFFIYIIFFTMFFQFIALFFFSVDEFGRKSGFFPNPNTLAILIQLSLPIAISVLIVEKERFLKLFSILYVILASYSLLLTGSRGGIVATFISVFILPFLVRRFISKKKFYSLLSLFLFSFMILIVLFLQNKNIFIHTKGAIGAVSYDTSLIRVIEYLVMIKNIIANPILGTGIGSFRIEFLHDIKSLEYLFDYTSDALNIYLNLWMETGIIGLLVFLSLIAYVVKTMKHVISNSLNFGIQKSDKLLYILIGIQASIIGFLFYGLVEVVFYSMGAYLFWTYVGIFEAIKVKFRGINH